MKKQSPWDKKEIAASRAKRQGSSAPTKEELAVYKKHLKQAIQTKKNAKALILGATPELRDLCLEAGCETIAIDISQKVITAMNKVMKHKDSPKNLIKQSDWLKMPDILPKNHFDIALADASLNNLTPKNQVKLLKILTQLLKPNAYFITRNLIYLPNKPKQNISYFQKQYNQNKTTWLMFCFALAYYTNWQPKAYNPKTKKQPVAKLLHLLKSALKKQELKLGKEDNWKIKNIIDHAHKIIHYTLPKKDFEKMLKKYFHIKKIAQTKCWAYSEFVPIYVLKKKK